MSLRFRPSWFLPGAVLIALLAVFLVAGCATTTRTSTSTAGDVNDRPLEACTSSDDCGDVEYCRYALGACGGTGSCEPRPEVCTKEFNPVCACDQDTYSNACGAASEGLSILKPGRCGTDD